MEHEILNLVTDSSDEDEAISLSGEAQCTGDGALSPPEQEARSAPNSPAPFAVRRKHFLHGTASTLMLSRVQSLRELQGLVDDLGSTIATLGEVRQALERASDLHARLDRLLKEDMRQAEANVDKHSFSRSGVGISPFSTALSTVTDMFMINMEDEQ
jgi:hypothetical protein